MQSAETRITDSGNWIGTVDFMAPEHLRGEPTDARTDVYALGCVLYTALTGEPPFRRQTVPATITAHLHEPPPRPSVDAPGVPVAFDSVIARALAKDPADRYPSAGDLGRAARAAATGERVSTARGSVATGAATPEEAEPTRMAPAPGATAVLERPDDATRVAGRGGGDGRGRGRRGRPATSGRRQGPARPRAQAGADGDDRRPADPDGADRALDLGRRLGQDGAFERRRGAIGGHGVRRRLHRRGRRGAAPGPDAQRAPLRDDGRRATGPAWRWSTPTGRSSPPTTSRSTSSSDLKTTGGTAGRAEGRYTVKRGNAAPITGRIVFLVVRRDGEARIDLIATEPRPA